MTDTFIETPEFLVAEAIRIMEDDPEHAREHLTKVIKILSQPVAQAAAIQIPKPVVDFERESQ